MIFGLGATVLERLFGDWLKPFVLPVLLIAAGTFGKIAWDKRDARLVTEGERICNVSWERQIRDQERAAVEADIRSGRRIIEVERQIDEGLTNDLRELQTSIDVLRAPPGDGGDSCLSPGVLDLLGGGRKPEGGAAAGDIKARKPAP